MPTRGNNILDLVFTTDIHLITACEVGEPFASSDHNIIRYVLYIETKARENTLLIPNYRKPNFNDLRKELALVNWNHLLNNESAQKMHNRFTAQITASVNKLIPLKPRRTENQKPLWMTNYLQKIFVEKKKAV